MRPLAVVALAVLCSTLVLAAAPSPARAMTPANATPMTTWWIGPSAKLLVRVLEFVDWAVEDLRAQVDRRRTWDPAPPLLGPPLEAVASGGTTTAPGDAPPARRAPGGMIP